MVEKIATIENSKAEYALETENKFIERVKVVERKVYVIEKTNAGNDFCEYCDEEFDDMKEMRIHERDKHTLECNLYELRLVDFEINSQIKSKHDNKRTTIHHFKMNKANLVISKIPRYICTTLPTDPPRPTLPYPYQYGCD